MFLTDNNINNPKFLTDEEAFALNPIANTSLIELKKNYKNIVVFPDTNIKDNDDQHVLDIYQNKLNTFNIIGFISVNSIRVDIGSRFAPEEHGKQYFIQYMLKKILKLDLIDLPTSYGGHNVWEQLLYIIFPVYLKRAYQQGIYKIYQKKEYNDSNVKGRIDISRHIKKNVPFLGKVAYITRDHNYNNPITQLIRHTIERIECTEGFSALLASDSDIINAVKSIKLSTPDYHIRAQNEILSKNSMVVNHPYFTEYEPLRRICIQILTHKGLSFENKTNEISGILIDAAWLWEEYLNTILKDLKFTHPRNNSKYGGLTLFEGKVIYPDFYIKNNIVIDSKYKRIPKLEDIAREDIFQVVTYMYRLKTKYGLLLHPVQNHENDKLEIRKMNEESYGEGDSYFGHYGFYIPKENGDFSNFCEDMKVSETNCREKVNIF